MLSERARTAVEVLKLVRTEIKASVFTAAASKPEAADYLRALVIVSLDTVRGGSTMKEYWEAMRLLFMAGSSKELELMIEILRDEEVFDSLHRADVEECVQTHVMPLALHDSRLQALAERIWAPSYEEGVAQELWRKAFANFDMPAIERLAERVSVEDVDFSQIMVGNDRVAVVQFFARRLSDQGLARALESVHAYLLAPENGRLRGRPQNDACMGPLFLLTAEHVRRHGMASELPWRFFDALDQWGDAWMRGLEDVAGEVAAMACDLGRLSSHSVTRLVYRYVNSIPAPELARFVESGLPVVQSDLAAAQLGRATSGLKYLLPNAKGEQRLIVAKAMTEQQRREYLTDSEGLVRSLPAMANEWGSENSATDDSVLTALHTAGFDLAQKVPLYAGLDEMRHLHDLAHEWAQGRFLFVALHALGVYPQDLHFEGFGPMHYAASYNDHKAIDKLVALGHDVDARSDRWSAKMFKGRTNESEWTPLMLAVKYGRSKSVEALLAHGADVAYTSPGGHSAAKLAAAPLDKKASTFDKQRADDIKRLLKAVRLGQKISGAMSSELEQGDVPAQPRGTSIL